MSETVFDVALIGYGPAGATLANLLGQSRAVGRGAGERPRYLPVTRAPSTLTAK
jgi:flavin-dependent dehydrogenase